MIEQGLIDEVKEIYQKYQSFPTAMQGLGYKEVVEYLEGKISKDDMIEKIKQELCERRRMVVRFMKVRGHEKDVNNPIIYGNHVADMLADYKNFDNYELDKMIEL